LQKSHRFCIRVPKRKAARLSDTAGVGSIIDHQRG
jgi:hypothetical protein